MNHRQRVEERGAADIPALARGIVRFGWRLTLLPAVPLPQAVRGAAFRAARSFVDAAYCVPLSPRDWVDDLADELDELESDFARREDLGSRLRREARQRQRRPAETS